MYQIEASGRWTPDNFHRYPEINVKSKKSIEDWAATDISHVLCNKMWVEGDAAKIEVNVEADATVRKRLDFKDRPGIWEGASP